MDRTTRPCPRCGSVDVRRSRRRPPDRWLSLIGLFPWRCLRCTRRFRRFGRG
ncbi:MAG TPA: hypothetical protein RMH99_23720 [Sandaracinaceae bacterium LLY-WYZ-13_1]|nr:hypothetical protein [Sandaracinaceae bacterium LLY-WYZ-13_1]